MHFLPFHDAIAHASRSVLSLLLAGAFSMAINLFLGTLKLLGAARRSA